MKTIEFHHISLSNPDRDYLAKLDDSDKVVINGPAVVRFSYPFDKPRDLILTHESGKFTLAAIIRAVAEKYQQIYREEEESTTLPVETIADRCRQEGNTKCVLINRAETNGVWGIWGHVLADLALCAIKWNEKDQVWELVVDS